MMQKIVLQIATEIRWREIYLYTFLWIMMLYKFKRWYKIAIRTYQYYTVCRIKNTIGYHFDRNIHIGLLLSGFNGDAVK